MSEPIVLQRWYLADEARRRIRTSSVAASNWLALLGIDELLRPQRSRTQRFEEHQLINQGDFCIWGAERTMPHAKHQC
jgi:hypothetical protein